MALVAPELSAKYELVSPSGNRVVFNDVSDPDYAGVLTEHSGFDSPEIREESENRVGADGANHGVFLFGRRPMTLTGRFLNPASTYERAVRIDRVERAVLDCLRSDGVLTWTLSTGQTLMTRVRTQQPPRIEGAWQKTFQIAMVAADPLFYSATESYASRVYSEPVPPLTFNGDDYAASTDAPRGPRLSLNSRSLPFPWTFPIDWTALPENPTLAVTHSVVVDNQGTAWTPPILSVGGLANPSGESVGLYNVTTGQHFSLTTTIGADDDLVVDMGRKTVKINGSSAYDRVRTQESDWWQLAPGSNEVHLVLTGTSGPASITPLYHSRLQVAWRDAWR